LSALAAAAALALVDDVVDMATAAAMDGRRLREQHLTAR
jgi:hypothetical protein